MTGRRATEADAVYTHLPRAWRDHVALLLRARGASGRTIGDALAIAEAHCADSGEPVAATFGTAQEYADSVRLSPEETRADTSQVIRSGLPSLLGLVGMMLSFATVDAWQADTRVVVRWGLIGGVLLTLAVSIALVLRIELLARRSGVLIAAVIGLAATGLTTLGLVTTPTALRPPAGAAALVALALLAASVMASRRLVDADPIDDPLRGDPNPRATRTLQRVSAWFFPALTLLGILLNLLIDAAVGP